MPGESHGQGSLAGYNPWGHEESDTAEHSTDSVLEAFLLLLSNLVFLDVVWKKIMFYLVLVMAPGLFIEMTFVLNNLAAFPFSSEEIVVILANLLDNAIEACCKLKGQREIHVKMLCEEAQTILSVRNTR